MSPSAYIVADIDGTLCGLPNRKSGEYEHPPLKDSPCFEPLKQWLQMGGRLCCITSDDGMRPWNDMWENLPAHLRADRRVLMATSEGATLWYGDEEGNPQEESRYRETALKEHSDRSTGIAQKEVPAVMELGHKMQLAFFADLVEDETLLATLPKQSQEAFPKIINRVKEGESLEAVLTMEALLTFGTVTRGSMLWRNVAGPPLAKSLEEHPARDNPKFLWEEYLRLKEQPESSTELFTNVIVMSMPNTVSSKYVGLIQQELEDYGLVASIAPNSVWLKRALVDKSMPLKWLAGDGADDYEFSFGSAIAFGDNPSTNDGPLATFEDMPFLSCAATVEETPEILRSRHIGGQERGTAKILEHLIANGSATEVSTGADPAAHMSALRSELDDVVAACRC